jgi:hypothetical protein
MLSVTSCYAQSHSVAIEFLAVANQLIEVNSPKLCEMDFPISFATDNNCIQACSSMP